MMRGEADNLVQIHWVTQRGFSLKWGEEKEEKEEGHQGGDFGTDGTQ